MFDDILDKKEGFRVVYLNDKQNYLSDKNKLLFPDLWFDWVKDEYKGFRTIRLNSKYNYLDKDNKLLSPDTWFDKLPLYNSNDISQIKIADKI